MANFCVAFIALLLFFGPVLGAIAPLSDAMIVGINESSPAQTAGLQEDMVITQVDDTNITTGMDFLSYLETVEPGDTLRIHASKDDTVSVYELKVPSSSEECLNGVPVGGIVEGSPAEEAGIETGMTMIRIDDTQMRSIASFVDFMEGTEPNQTIEVELLPPSTNYTGDLTENGTAVFNVHLAPPTLRAVTSASLEYHMEVKEFWNVLRLECPSGCPPRQSSILKRSNRYLPCFPSL